MASNRADLTGGEITRRRLLQRGAGLGFGVIAIGGLDACGGGDSDSSTEGSPAQSGGPARGGLLEVSVTDTNNADRLNPIVPINTNDILSQAMVFDGLTRIDKDFKVTPGLAESWESNADGTRLGVPPPVGRRVP